MMPLLSQVYRGRIGSQETKLKEYGGQKMDAQVVEGGIRIAAISQSDLEYDPALYRRDRGELDWDARSMASTAMFSDTASVMGPGGGGGFYAGSNATLPGYDRYLAQGPGVNSPMEQFELARLDSPNEPLLSPRAQYFQPHAAISSNSLSQPPLMHRDTTTDGLSREATLHRPNEQFNNYSDMGAYRTGSPFEARTTTPFAEPRSNSPLPRYPPQPTRQFTSDQYPPHPTHQFSDQHSTYSYNGSPQMYPGHAQDPSNGSMNMAGRGAHRT